MTGVMVFRNTLIFIATFIIVYLFYISSDIVVTLIIAIILASAIRPMVLRLQQWRIPQGIAIGLVYTTLGFLFVVLLVLVLPPMVNEIVTYLRNENRLASRIIFTQTTVQAFMNERLGLQIPIATEELIRSSVSNMLDQLTVSAPAMLQNLASVVSNTILILVMGVYWLTSRDRAVKFAVELFPLSRRLLAQDIINEIETGIGLYMRGIVLVSLLVGGINFVIFSLLGITNAAALALLMGITTAIPIIGGLVGVLLITLLALLASPLEAVLVFGIAVAVQQFESYVLSPRIMARGVGFDTILVFLFVTAGFTIGGTVGALIAVPIAGAVYVLVKHIIIEPHRQEVQSNDNIDGLIMLGSKEHREGDMENLEIAAS
jgi:predicted PurR-regulated permease PerM